jgi:hypothetical protein
MLYRELGRGFPVRVVSATAGPTVLLERADIEAYRKTPKARFSSSRRGFDERRGELARLRELGLRDNTVLVHGVGLSPDDWSSVCRAGAGLVWCPASNRFLLGRSAPIDDFLHSEPESRSAVALGTDSRLSGARDLLEELREARTAASVEPEDLLRMVTANAAGLLRLPEAGRLSPGLPADLLVIPPLAGDPAQALLALDRSQIRLVVVEGRPLIGAPELSSVFAARRVAAARAMLDGQERILDGALARRTGFVLAEPGLSYAVRYPARGDSWWATTRPTSGDTVIDPEPGALSRGRRDELISPDAVWLTRIRRASRKPLPTRPCGRARAARQRRRR